MHPHNAAYTLSLLASPTPHRLALGTTTTLPPTPASFTENPDFLPRLQRLVGEHAAHDPLVQADAQQMASPAGASLFGGHLHNTRRARCEGGAGGANYQGGSGGGGVGGWVHVYDQRGVPAFGRIADTEDIFGSLLVDGHGVILPDQWEPNRMYRLVSRNGVMRLSPHLREKVVQGLAAEAAAGAS